MRKQKGKAIPNEEVGRRSRFGKGEVLFEVLEISFFRYASLTPAFGRGCLLFMSSLPLLFFVLLAEKTSK